MRHRWAAAVVAAGALVLSATAGGVGTPAGTDIQNQAEITFERGGVTLARASNVVTLTVAEILDADVLVQSAQRLVRPGDTAQTLLFTLTNTGNGNESFRLGFDSALPGDDFDPVPAAPALYFDADADGRLSPADVPYSPGTNDPTLAPDASIDVLVVNAIPSGLADGQRGWSQLAARAVTGNGAPGTSFPGRGDAGVDAVAGTNGADDEAAGEYLVGSVSLTLVKSATVSDPTGGSSPVTGASIRYSVQISAQGSGAATDTIFQDGIPAFTSFVPGSIRLNGATLTDARDGDAGEFGGAEVVVDLGTLDPADGAQSVEFEVTID